MSKISVTNNIKEITWRAFSPILMMLFSYSLLVAQTPTPPPKILLKNYRPHSIFHIPEHPDTKAKYPIIDIHSHAKFARSAQDVAQWVKTMDEVGVKKTIILSYSTGARFDSLYKAFAGKYPNHFIMYCSIDFTGYKKPGWSKKVIKELIRDHKEGARGIGELGDKGRGLFYAYPRDGNRMHPDDARLIPFFTEAAKLHMPVSMHISDPMWMYEPMDSTNDGLMNAWDWRETDKKGLNHFQLIQVLINTLKENPNTTFIACHYANLVYNLKKLGKIFDKYHNLYVDISSRFEEIATVPRDVKKFITKYQNRLMYGTDMGTSRRMYETTFRILQTSDEHFYTGYEYHWPLYGIDLSNEVLEKVYYKNAQRILNITF